MQIQSIGGVLPITPLSVLQAEDAARDAARIANNQPVVQGLAAHVRTKWSEAKREKEMGGAERRMLQALRQKRGEYEPELLSALRAQGSSEIYMGISSVKARAAASWLRDVLMGQHDEKPWLVSPTPQPELSPQDVQRAQQAAYQEALQIEMQGGVVTQDILVDIVQRMRDRMDEKVMEEARRKAERMNTKMEDQLLEGGYHKAFSDFVDDITIFPSAVLKGPVVRNLKKLKWSQTGEMQIEDTLTLQWERVDPLMLYPERGAADVDNGFLFERHKLSRSALLSMIGVEGYNEGAIRAVLSENDRGGLQEWLNVDAERKPETSTTFETPSTIEALQFWGSVPGSMLRDWGMGTDEVPVATEEYNVEVWLIGSWVIKATVNPDPLGRKPYYKASYEQVPGEFWGHSVMDLTRDVQNMANAAARALANNMGIASGPQVWVNIDRLPAGEDITQLHPWKIWQTRSDPYGSATTAPPIDFFAPPSLAAELIGVFEHFSKLADEYSGIPRYMTGDHNVGGAARTASGMSMLMGNAGKAMKQVVANVDDNVLQPMLERLYDHNMRYADDPDLKGDVQIIARGANALIVKEQAQVRRNEFMQIALAAPPVMELLGMTGLAELLRPIAADLDIDTDKLIPPAPVIQAREQQKAMMQMLAMQAAGAQAAGQAGPGGQQRAAQRPGSGQRLADGNQATDNFAPPRRG